MGHHHTHHHTNQKNLLLSISLNLLITLAQLIGGVLSGSLALLSDAVHNLSDVVSLVMTYIAALYTKKEATTKRTFGYKRAGILVAFINALSLILIAIYLIFEAIGRFYHPESITVNLVIYLSALGIIFNGLSVLLLRKGSQTNLNLKSAYLHLLSDMLASIAVLFGGLLMANYQIFWIDSVLTIVIALYLIYIGFDLLKSSYNILMLFTPQDINIETIVEDIQTFTSITNIHHIHVWELNEDEIHLEAHIDFKHNITLQEFQVELFKIEKHLLEKFKINHITIQPEFGKIDSKATIVQD